MLVICSIVLPGFADIVIEDPSFFGYIADLDDGSSVFDVVGDDDISTFAVDSGPLNKFSYSWAGNSSAWVGLYYSYGGQVSTTFQLPNISNFTPSTTKHVLLTQSSVSPPAGYLVEVWSNSYPGSSPSIFISFDQLRGKTVSSLSLAGTLSTYFYVSYGSYSGSTSISSAQLVYYTDATSSPVVISNLSFSGSVISFNSSTSYFVNNSVARLGILVTYSSWPTLSHMNYSWPVNGNWSVYVGPLSGSYEVTIPHDEAVERDLGAILASVGSDLYNMVKNGFQSVIAAITGSRDDPTPSQSQAASDFKDSAQDQKDKIDQAQEEIDQNTNRPPPESLMPTTPPIIVDGQIGGGDEVALSAVAGFSDFLGSELILSMLLLVFTLAFVSYVLFGKKG